MIKNTVTIYFLYNSGTCKECCLKDNDYELSGSKRYPQAVLEVCTCKFSAYPQIQGIYIYIYIKSM